jgi:RNA-directed DNA polymerase
VKGRSIKTNASQHVGRRYVANIDLEDFYPTIHFKRISQILRSSRYSLHPDVATAVAQLCCYQGRLPIGAPTSGIISNIVSGPLDSALMRLAKRNRLRYTRYVDDLTFSAPSAGHLAAALGLDLREALILRGSEHLSFDFVEIIRSSGFEINSNKVWASTRQVRQQVTGLVVNKKVNVSIKYFRQTRSMVHSVEKFGYIAADSVYQSAKKQSDSRTLSGHLLGRLAYIGQITDYDARYTRLAKKLLAVMPGASLPLPLMDRDKSVYVVETLPNKFQGTALHIGDGFFLTAAHTLNKPSPELSTTVHCPDYYPTPVVCAIKEIDWDLDIALLRASASSAVAQRPNIKTSLRSISVGDQVEGFGFANYYPGTGMNKVKARVTALRKLDGKPRCEVDLPWPHGMSGGPVFDDNGVFVGIIFSGPQHGTVTSPFGTAFTPYSLFRETLATWLVGHA